VLMTGLAFMSISCDKLLDVPPQNKLTLDQFWISGDQALAYIAGIYSNLGSTQCNITSGNVSSTSISPVESYIYWGEMRGELMMSNPGRLPTDQVPKENVDAFLVTPNDVTTKFTSFYRIINETNQAIKKIPEIMLKDPAFSQTLSDQLTGEAYFIRAFAYFWLVRTFKEVPLVLQPSETDNQDYNLPKSTSAEIFNQIVNDLDRAILTLPEWYDNNLYAHCRATKYTAKTVLADVYLWMAALSSNSADANVYYQKVIENCDFVLNSGRYFMVPGANIGTIYSQGGTSESIFETYSNASLNNQTNNLYAWFNSSAYFKVTASVPSLFPGSDDYRGPSVPGGPYPPKGSVFSYSASNSLILKYNKGTSDAIWNFYRYPELLLMKAEALAHLYPDDMVQLQNAADLIDLVRARAFGVPDFEKVLATSANDIDNAILLERAREFLGEGKRWFELLRFASRDNFAHPEILIEKIVQSYSSIEQLLIRPRLTNPESWFFPLNADALAANPNLIQNPYYD